MAIQRIDETTCDGCRICVDYSCPMDVLRMDEGRRVATIAYPQDCMSCLACEEECPRGSIVVGPEFATPLPSPWDEGEE